MKTINGWTKTIVILIALLIVVAILSPIISLICAIIGLIAAFAWPITILGVVLWFIKAISTPAN